MTETQTNTEVKSFDDVIAEFDLAEQKEQKEDNTFSKQDSSFDKIVNEEKGEEVEEKKEKTTFDEVVETIEKEEVKEKVEEVKVVNNVPLYSALNKLVEEGSFFLFDDKQDIKDYTEEELIDLLKENDKFKKESSLQTEIEEFFGSLPKEIQYAAKYAADGGKDLKNLFKALSVTEDIKSLDVKKDAEMIVRNYYSSIDWEEEDIQDKIATLTDLGTEALEKEAGKVKPKLEKMSEETIQAQILQQTQAEQKRNAEMQQYFTNAADTIKKGTIGEIKLDKKTQIDLYSGLTQANFKTRRGTSTNELGHLLEKFQYTEPNFEKMYKVLWLLKDENTFFDKFSSKAVNKEVDKTVRTLKTEQSKKDTTTAQEEKEDNKITKKTIKRNLPDFMSGIK